MDKRLFVQDMNLFCKDKMLGELVQEPKELTGGLLHRMYEVTTDAGKYAVKALNPSIMCRPTAFQNYLDSEIIASYASDYVPALPAIKINERAIHKIDGRYYLIFDWIKGKTLKPNEIHSYHCEKMGRILSDLHKIDFSSLGIDCHPFEDERKSVDWSEYLKRGKEDNLKWAEMLNEILGDLHGWHQAATASGLTLKEHTVICHCDLDPKNVMWNGDQPILIDWESAGYRNPMQDLFETALYWSENEAGEIDQAKFLGFLKGYQHHTGTMHTNWKFILANGYMGKLEWLEYNLKRSLWIDCTDDKEQQLGTEQVIKTILEIKHYAEMVPEVEKWLANFYR